MKPTVFLALALLCAPLSYAAPLASPYSISIYPAQTFTATGQTGTVIPLNGLTVPSTVGSSFASGTITVTGTSLTTATFSIQGSSDGGGTYFVLPIIDPLAAPSSSAPATTVTVTANATYMVSLAGITHVRLVTSGTFTATALSLTLTASPNAQVSRNRGTGGSFTPPVGSGRQAYMTPADGSSGPAALRFIAPPDLPLATSSTVGVMKPDNSTLVVDSSGTISVNPPSASGSVSSATAGQLGCYNATGNTIAGCAKIWQINSGMTLTQINAVFTAADVNSLVIIGNNVPQYAWNNVHDAQVQDNRIASMDWSNWFARKGVVCDYRFNLHGGGGYTLTQGSDQLSIGSDPYAIGSRMIFAQQVNFGTLGMIQNVWMPKILGFSTFPFVTLSGPAPFNYTGGAGNGTDNLSSLQAVFNEAGATFPVRIPSGCSAFTSQPLNWPGTSLYGSAGSRIAGAPGADVIDSITAEATIAGVEVHNLNLVVNSQIDTTLGYRLYSDDGSTFTTVPPRYIPVMNNTSNANHPLSDQFVTGGSNGVAAITDGSAVICVPNALGRTPPNGQTILFPYLTINALFNTTVLNQTGAGCAGGSTGVTLNAALPTGTTATQAYWEAGTAFETGNTNIGITPSYPLTVAVSLTNAPDPQGVAAAWGHFIIGNNSERFEADYMGNNYSAVPGSGTFVLRKGPATIANALAAGNYFMIPANPCAANFETPPPVVPNINGSSAITPLGAVDIPGGCVSNAGIAFLEPDGTHPYTGLVSSVIGPVTVSSSSGQINNSAAIVQQGNAAAYSVSFPDWKISQVEYGFAQGPASANNYGIAAIAPTATGNSISNCQIFAAFPIVLSDFQQGNINRCDTYTSLQSPYDATTVGAATGLSLSFTSNEQTGGSVTICNQVWVNNWNSEPENGTHIAIPAFAYVGCGNAVFEESNFEGALSIFAGGNITVKNSQLSLPVINYGRGNKFENNYGINPFWVTNNWADNSQQWFNWGWLSECSEQVAGVASPKMPCGSGFYESASGHSILSSYFGTDLSAENEKGGGILPGEIGFGTTFKGPFKDSTEPYWQSYTLCDQVGNDCHTTNFDGSGVIYIGQHNRIGPAPYNFIMTVKQTTGSPNTFVIVFGAFDSGTGTCGSVGQFGAIAVPVTTTWVKQSVPVDFTGKAGCVLQLQVETLTNPVQIGEMNFIPQMHDIVITPPVDSIYNTACKIPGKDYGVSATGYSYVCVAGTIKRFGPAS